MIKIGWPTYRSDISVEVWRLLDMSGLTNSVRSSRNYTKSGYVYVDGNLINSLKFQVPMGVPMVLELRFPNGRVMSEEIMVVSHTRMSDLKPRERSPGTNQYLNDPPKYFYKG